MQLLLPTLLEETSANGQVCSSRCPVFYLWSCMQLKKRGKQTSLSFCLSDVLAGEDRGFPPRPATAPLRGAHDPADLPWARDVAVVPSVPGQKGPPPADVFQNPVTRSVSVGTGTQHAHLPALYTHRVPFGTGCTRVQPPDGSKCPSPQAPGWAACHSATGSDSIRWPGLP